MAKNVTITWDLPTARVEGGPLPVDEIARVQVEMSADGGANFVPLVDVTPAEPQQAYIPDLEVGSYEFRKIVFTTDGQQSDAVVTEVTVVDDSRPMPVTNVQVTQA